jgi:hypothetical protein
MEGELAELMSELHPELKIGEDGIMHLKSV